MKFSMNRFLSLILCILMLVLSLPLASAESVPDILIMDEDEDLFYDDQEEESDYDEATAEAAAELTLEEELLMAELAEALEDATEETLVDEGNLEINEKLPDNVINILLLGIDNRSVEMQSGRSDAIIICSINKQTGSVKLTSIARDTAVTVPGYKYVQRVNVAFKFGSKKNDMAKGAELAMRTLNRNFNMNLSRYVLVNIHGLADIIEALGGVDLELTKSEASAINYELFVKEPMDKVRRSRLVQEKGVQHLDGMQAVTYGRIRNLKGQNDINRNSRQRHLLEVLLSKVMEDMDLNKFLTLVETALPYGRTNLTVDEILTLGLTVLGGEALQNLQNGKPVLEQFSIPMDGEFGYKSFKQDSKGSTVSLVYISDKRMEETLAAWQEFVYGETY